MAVTNKFYGLFFQSLATKKIDTSADTFKAMLVTSSYTFNQDTHQYKSDVTNEVTGTGYTAGGVALTSFAVTYDGASNTLKIDADDATWNPLTTTARGLVVYDSTPGSDATRPLVCFVDFGQDQSPSAGPLTTAWNASGIATVTVS